MNLFITKNHMLLTTRLRQTNESVPKLIGKGLFALFTITMVFVVTLTAHAQEQGPPKEMSYEISLSPLYQSTANIDGGGKFKLSSLFLRFKARRSISPTTSIGLNLKYDVDDYDFTGTTDFGGTQPWNDVRRFGIGIPIFTRFENNWALGISPAVDWLKENGADSGDSLSYGATTFIFKSLTRDKRIGLGAGVFKTVDDDTRIFPFIAVDWRFNERWRLSNPFEADALGPAGLELTYSFSDRWHLGGGGVYRSFRFRLNSEGAAPNGIGENKGIVSYLRLRRAATSGIEIDFYAGAILGGELELKDRNGEDLASREYDTAPFAALTLSFAF